MNREYNRPASIPYDGALIKKRNKNPEADQEFFEWCKVNSVNYSSYTTFGKVLGLDGRCFRRLCERNGVELSFDPKAPNTPKLYQDKEWLTKQCIELNKTNKQISQENGWTERVVMKWVDLYGLHKRNYKKLKSLDFLQREIIIGSIVGDGHIAKNNSFIISHCESQKDYLYWKYEILQSVCLTPPSYYPSTIKKMGGKEYCCQPSYRFNTRLLDELGEINSIPVIEIINNLSELQFSIWMLDDGSRQEYRWQLCLAPYSDEEKTAFVKKMGEWGLSPKFHMGDDRYADFCVHDARKIDKIILRHLPEDLDIIQDKIMKYKKEEVMPE